jgi:uncharacterized membrane protein YoaK (UPF0700 family)
MKKELRDFVTLRRRNMLIWFVLAFQAGAVNAGGFIACKRFVTHTTGFATHFAFELATKNLHMAWSMLTVPAFFLLGAMITSFFVDLRLGENRSPNYRMPASLISICLLAAMLLGKFGYFGIFGDESMVSRDYLLMVLLCLASGLQNALFTNGSGMVVRTTHLTGVTTDLAASLVRLFFGHHRDWHHTKFDIKTSVARIGIIGSFVLGSASCAFLFLKVKYMGFAVPVLTSLGLLRYFVLTT